MAPVTGLDNSPPIPAPVAAEPRRPRLHHVDYMRPFKQGLVITTHSLLLFAPAASATAGAVLLVTHLGRFAFMFISAAMLVYAYPHLERANFGRFWRRRLLAVAVPYALWTLFYFFWESVPGVSAMYRPTGGITRSALTSLDHFGYLLLSGYYQLYFLVLLLEFYLVYPLFLWLLRRGARRPWLLLATSAAAQLGITCLLHWGLTPGWLNGFWGAREIWDYQLYLVAGGLMALYYREVHAWLCRHWRLVLLASRRHPRQCRGMVLARRPQDRTPAWRDQPGRPLSACGHTAICVPDRRYLPPRCRRSPSASASVDPLRGSVGGRQFLWHLPEPGTFPQHYFHARLGEVGDFTILASSSLRSGGRRFRLFGRTYCRPCSLARRQGHLRTAPPTVAPSLRHPGHPNWWPARRPR